MGVVGGWVGGRWWGVGGGGGGGGGVVRGAATWVAAFQKGRRHLLDEDLNLQPSTQAGHSKCRQAKRSQKLGLLMNPLWILECGGRSHRTRRHVVR